MKILKFCFLLLLATIISSASAYTLDSSKVLNNADMSSYRSFSLITVKSEKLPPSFNVGDAQMLKQAVANELKSRGYVELRRGGDMQIDITLSAEKSVERSRETVGSRSVTTGGRVGSGVGPGSGTYRSGSLSLSTTGTAEVVTDGVISVDIKESRGGKYLFSAKLSSISDLQDLILKDNVELNKAIEKLFKRYPVKKRK
ncbi:MAG: DUF4136 domain-containing protein [Rikenellaceae bacterium]